MRTTLLTALVLVPALALGACTDTSETTTDTSVTTEATEATEAADTDDRDALLQRLIEEEKVAHDLYTAFDENYGTQVFSNITRGEVGHQDAVLRVLDAAGTDDPRTGVPGEFTDPELQELYDDLLARGLASETAAYQVGVDFETWDITELENDLAATPEDDTELRELLQFLIDGSQRHLAAFERQLDRPRGR